MYISTLLASVLGLAIKTVSLGLGYAITMTTAKSYVQTYMSSIGKDYDRIATSGCQFNQAKITYNYKQHGSNDEHIGLLTSCY